MAPNPQPDPSLPPTSPSDRRIRAALAPLQEFLHTEAASGVVLLAAAVVAIVWASSPWSGSYEALWSTELTLGTSRFHISEDLRHWVNDLAMALFFFVVGLEIKREVVHGELRHRRTAMLPAVCALGGMVVPALIYALFNAGGEGSAGWGIPMATDIAFSIGVLALLGRRLPASLKIFLLTLAVVDDIGAIVVIALFYSDGVSVAWLGAAVGAVATIALLRRIGVRSFVPYVVLAGALWLATFESGVHATIAGVALGLLTPAKPLGRPSDGSSSTTVAEAPLTRLERRLHPYSSYVVLPLFALANAGIDLTPVGTTLTLSSPIAIGVIAGLVVGKPLGITAAALVATRFARAPLPAHAGWIDLVGVGALAGIGFTVSLFITELAFDASLATEAKLAILVASVVAGGFGATLLWSRRSRPRS
jgi:NhaA family Na+:H+ antiporter